MKKCAYILILIAAIAFASCNGGATSAAGNSNNDNFVTKKIHTVCLLDSSDEKSPKYETNISVELLEPDNKERENKINSTIANAVFGYDDLSFDAAADSFIANAHAEYADLLPEYLNEKQINENPSWFNFSHIIKTHIEHGRKDVINYVIANEYYTGGAHPNSAYTIINFDAQTGDEIKLEDIFKDDYEESLCNRLTDALAEKIGARSRKEIQEKGYLTFNDIFPTENFIIKDDSILFCYNLYEIAPRAAGITTLGFTYEELSIILK